MTNPSPIEWNPEDHNLWMGTAPEGEYVVYRVLGPKADPKFPWGVVTPYNGQFLVENAEQGKWLCDTIELRGDFDE